MRIKHQASFTFNRSAEILFPLFSAEGEKLWVPGWDYESIMGSTELHEDYVFLTAGHPPPDRHNRNHHGLIHHGAHPHQPAHQEPEKLIWLVKRYEPENFYVQFYRVEPSVKVGIVSVQCIPIEEALTKVEVTYEYIGLSKKGDDFIEDYSAEVHEASIAKWALHLEDYFEAK